MNTHWSPFLQGRSGVDLNHGLSSASPVPSATGDTAPRSPDQRLRRPPVEPRSVASRPGRFRLIPLVSLIARK